MDEEAQSRGKKTWKHPGNFYAWLILATAIFVTLMAVTQFLPGGTRSFSDWVPPALFLLGVSLVSAAIFLGAWRMIRWLCRGRSCK